MSDYVGVREREIDFKTYVTGNSLVVQGSELSTFAAKAQVQSLVRKLTSHKPHDVAKKLKKNFFLILNKLKKIYMTEIVKKKKKKERKSVREDIYICMLKDKWRKKGPST